MLANTFELSPRDSYLSLAFFAFDVHKLQSHNGGKQELSRLWHMFVTKMLFETLLSAPKVVLITYFISHCISPKRILYVSSESKCRKTVFLLSGKANI